MPRGTARGAAPRAFVTLSPTPEAAAHSARTVRLEILDIRVSIAEYFDNTRNVES
jgi:hypothetical protein